MEIYVDNGVLTCAPFGRGRGEVLTYDGIDIMNIDMWQHVSCTYIKQRYVKGQYLAVNMDPDGPKTGFFKTILRP
jgi:hypothetical protein